MMKRTPKTSTLPRSHEAAPADYDDALIYAWKAFQQGTANEFQQRRILVWLRDEATRMHDLSYRPDRPEASAFAEGRRFVGLQIMKMIQYPMARLRDAANREQAA